MNKKVEYVKYRLLKSLTMESGAVHLYDKFVVPVAKPVESFLPLPLGKNLLFVAEKVMSSQNREQ